jgi:hypothetical protein
MGWCKDGSTIKANYLGDEVVGVVQESRVKYGGKVQYRVKLDEPVQLRWRSEPTDVVLIDDDELIADFGVMENAYN